MTLKHINFIQQKQRFCFDKYIYINLNNIHSDSAFCYKHFSVLTCHCLHAHANVLLLKGPFTNTCKGAWSKKKINYRENFSGPPFRPQKKNSGPPFLPWKSLVNPIEKHVISIFNGKSVVIFSGHPLTRVKNFKGPPFLHQAPLTSVCERSLIYIDKFYNVNFVLFTVWSFYYHCNIKTWLYKNLKG